MDFDSKRPGPGRPDVMTPDTPPTTKRKMKLAKNRKAVVRIGRPVQSVAIQANADTALGAQPRPEHDLRGFANKIDVRTAKQHGAQQGGA